MSRKHFHTFDALRFFSFLLVFLLHLPKTGYDFIDFFLKSGGIGVTFFFVLSGFLITYILMYEKDTKGKIALKNFFLRRILRIWPLFYLMIAFAYLSPYILDALHLNSSDEGYQPHFWTSVFFGENYRMMWTDTFPDGAPLRVMWTICIEEHFYILWGLIFYFISQERIPIFIIGSIIVANIMRLIYTHFGISHLDVFTHLDYFAFGAIPAYIMMQKKSYMEVIGRVPIYMKYILLAVTAAAVFILPNIIDKEMTTTIFPIVLCPLFSVVILFTLGKHPIHISDDLWISKLGIYTYGLYLYHTIIILLMMKILETHSLESWFVLAISSLLITIVVSMISYAVFEKPFLKLKKYFY